MAMFQSGDAEGMRRMAQMMGPMVDKQIRQAIQFCWMAMPAERQNVREVTAEIRRLVDRALRDLADDAKAFSSGNSDDGDASAGGPEPLPPSP